MVDEAVDGGDDAPAAFAGVGEDVAHEVNAAALPCRAEQLGDSGLDAFMRIGDDELHAPEAAPGVARQSS